jgi:hypothetical protein
MESLGYWIHVRESRNSFILFTLSTVDVLIIDMVVVFPFKQKNSEIKCTELASTDVTYGLLTATAFVGQKLPRKLWFYCVIEHIEWLDKRNMKRYLNGHVTG